MTGSTTGLPGGQGPGVTFGRLGASSPRVVERGPWESRAPLLSPGRLRGPRAPGRGREGPLDALLWSLPAATLRGAPSASLTPAARSPLSIRRLVMPKEQLCGPSLRSPHGPRCPRRRSGSRPAGGGFSRVVSGPSVGRAPLNHGQALQRRLRIGTGVVRNARGSPSGTSEASLSPVPCAGSGSRAFWAFRPAAA